HRSGVARFHARSPPRLTPLLAPDPPCCVNRFIRYFLRRFVLRGIDRASGRPNRPTYELRLATSASQHPQYDPAVGGIRLAPLIGQADVGGRALAAVSLVHAQVSGRVP